MLRTMTSIHPASTLVFRPTPEASLPRALAPPRTGLAPASYRDLVARLRHVDSFVFMAPELLDAHSDIRLTRAGNLRGRLCSCSIVSLILLKDWSWCLGSGQSSTSLVSGRHQSIRYPAGSDTPRSVPLRTGLRIPRRLRRRRSLVDFIRGCALSSGSY